MTYNYPLILVMHLSGPFEWSQCVSYPFIMFSISVVSLFYLGAMAFILPCLNDIFNFKEAQILPLCIPSLFLYTKEYASIYAFIAQSTVMLEDQTTRCDNI